MTQAATQSSRGRRTPAGASSGGSAGFATTQEAYEEAFDALFVRLDEHLTQPHDRQS